MKLNRNQLKYLLITAMLIDHLTAAFVTPHTVLGQVLHFIGRLTGPGMSLLLAEGYQYTRDRKKYALRLLAFVFVSWVPYCLFCFRKWPYVGFGMFGMFWALFVAFMTVWMWDKLNVNKAVKVLLVIVAVGISSVGDWIGAAVLWALFAFIYKDDPVKKWIAYSVVALMWIAGTMILFKPAINSLYQIGVFAVPFIYTYLYNKKPGSKNAFHKWFFYAFYPAHMLILYLIVR